MGLKDFAILSDKFNIYANPKFFRTLKKKLSKTQRIMSRHKEGGWGPVVKTKIKVARIHENQQIREIIICIKLVPRYQKPRYDRNGRLS